ncbi:Putative serine protease K12H4.7 [Toxocara canis]|uniref:Putative serine protease K12H4.7 n=1 Tax=Toxocara canis TaxID=6265 RepID=A0A0B2W2Q8_TOXCA|nr:Putative serine protease K12H4.7 [Toxocara canis]
MDKSVCLLILAVICEFINPIEGRTEISQNDVSVINGLSNVIREKPLIGRNIIKQKLDHFNESDKRRWNQWFIHRKSRSQSPNGPIFLIIGGEGAADRNWLANQGLPHVLLADRMNASIYLLEHRFYGNSRPTKDLSKQSLKYLNARQAVQDIEAFVDHVNKREGLRDPKWIAVGGSYSGSLAAWSREKSPRKIRAAVASSAPLLAKVDFSEFGRQVEAIVTKTDIRCAHNIKSIFRQLTEKMKTQAGRHEIVEIFRLDDSLIRPKVSVKDIQNFFFVVRNYINFIIMHSAINARMHRDVLTLRSMCDILDGVSIQSLRKVISMVMIAQGKSPNTAIDVSYDNFVKFMKNERYAQPSSQPRAWLYQNCNEFGHFATSEDRNGFFGDTIPLSFFIGRCQDVFGPEYTKERILQNIASTNTYFGGNKNFKATDVIFPNGSDDPWFALGVLEARGNDVIFIDGTSHVADMYPSRSSDSHSLQLAQQRIRRKLEEFMS